MNLFVWIKNQGEYALALALFATVAGIAAAGLAYGWEGLAAVVAGSLALWVGPWPRLARTLGRRIDDWLFRPGPPKPARYAHERAPRRTRRQAPAHLLPYDRLKIRYGEHVAALLVFASGMGLIVLAAAVWALGTAWGLNNPGSKAIATLFFGGICVFALWRPDVEWVAEEDRSHTDDDIWTHKVSLDLDISRL
jgi:hypothetical protein